MTVPAFADVHNELRAVARELLGGTTPLAGDGGPPAPLPWATLAGLGWLGLEVDEALGGSGATFAEVAVVLEELGRAAAVGPFLGTAVLGVGLLTGLEPVAARDALLADVAAGGLRVAVVAPDPGAPVGFELQPSPGGFRLHGRADLVLDAPEADRLLVVARHPDGGLAVAVAGRDLAGLRIEGRPVVDATRSVALVDADEPFVPADLVLAIAGDPEAALHDLADRGALAVACDGLGVARAMLDATVAYAKERHQFDRPIGSFQAVKHACADLLVQLSIAEELVRVAVGDVVSGSDGAPRSVAMAAAHVGDAAVAVAGSAMQLHGGFGYTWESGIHTYLKRATFDRAAFGSPAAHRRGLAGGLVHRAAPA